MASSKKIQERLAKRNQKQPSPEEQSDQLLQQGEEQESEALSQQIEPNLIPEQTRETVVGPSMSESSIFSIGSCDDLASAVVEAGLAEGVVESLFVEPAKDVPSEPPAYYLVAMPAAVPVVSIRCETQEELKEAISNYAGPGRSSRLLCYYGASLPFYSSGGKLTAVELPSGEKLDLMPLQTLKTVSGLTMASTPFAELFAAHTEQEIEDE